LSVAAQTSGRSTASASAACVALEGLYERHANRILGFCIRRLHTRSEAEDALQTTFVHALRALQRGVVPISETAWLFKIAENTCLSAHRTTSRRQLHEADEPAELADSSLGDREQARENARELVAALAEVPANQRRALLLREWRGLSYREIAEEMHVTVGSVETLIFRARRNVAQVMSGKRTVRSRLAGALNLGSLSSALKSLFGGATTTAQIGALLAASTLIAIPAADSTRTPRTRSTPSPLTAGAGVPSPVQGSSRVSASHRSQPRSRVPVHPGPSVGRKDADERGASGAPAQEGEPPWANAPAQVAVPSEPGAQTPPLELPTLPSVPAPPVELPSLPAPLPELPTLPGQIVVPSVPELPALPVSPPEVTDVVPALPQLP
jgi:RNA polymerase sigma factor (sigma-70 family)